MFGFLSLQSFPASSRVSPCDRRKYKGFSKFIEEKCSICAFQLFYLKTILGQIGTTGLKAGVLTLL
jgi:hypothetical protein